MYDAIIIGAGMSGLAAGIRLAHFDRKVCILEQHTTIGGLNSFYRLRRRDYDVGLHALTNFVPRGTRRGPLPRLLKQLRFRWEDFQLAPQRYSAIRFPGIELRFGNGLELLNHEIETKFPQSAEDFRRLTGAIVDYDELDESLFARSAREFVGQYLRDPLLVEMLFCPLMWYGNARERDMDFGQFCIMFRSIFMEGFARPAAGVRLILKNLIRRYRELGGEIRLRAGVQRLHVENQQVRTVCLDNGEELTAQYVISSAGWFETLGMCDDHQLVSTEQEGQLSFTESVSILDCQPQSLGLLETIVFFNDSERFHWERPRDRLCDFRTGVVCSPNNYVYEDPAAATYLPEGVVRLTCLADFDLWCRLSDRQYPLEKLRCYMDSLASATRFVPDFRRHVIESDFFTPKTIHRFTWHRNGAVYGACQKQLDGRTHLQNLFICGTDQGMVGIVGAITSGVKIANQYVLKEAYRD